MGGRPLARSSFHSELEWYDGAGNKRKCPLDIDDRMTERDGLVLVTLSHNHLCTQVNPAVVKYSSSPLLVLILS